MTSHTIKDSHGMRPPKLIEFLVRLAALDGTDHWPSFNKLITVAIVSSYFVGKIIPPEVAIIVITSSHGATAWLRYLKEKKVKAPPKEEG